MIWDDLVINANKTKAKASKYNNHYLDQQCLKDTKLLKIKDTGQDKWPNP